MLSSRVSAVRSQAWIGFSLLVIALWVAWQIGGKIAADDFRSIEFTTLGFAACVVAVVVLRNWRKGFYLFLVWMLFEDLARKYLGNGTALFFGKDILALLVYISLFAAIRRGREKSFHPPFLIPLVLFIWLGAAQIFNPNSSAILYGLLGFKLYFYYVPLMFVGYALIRSDEDLRKFLSVNAALAGLIAFLGIIQAIVGHSFLNPTNLAPELQDLGELDKVTPLTGQLFSLPASVFVSSGRFGLYLIFALILSIGTAGYLLLHTRRHRTLTYAVIGIVGGATLFSGSRGAVMYSLTTTLVMTAGLLWGAPWRWGQAHRLVKAVRRYFIVGALGLTAILMIFPDQAGSRIAYYSETLLPSSSAYEVGNRTWDYPIRELLKAFDRPNWMFGNGIGTASLGTQYVSKFLQQPATNLGVEEGFGVMIIEMGIVAPFLWLLWTGALLYSAWRVVRQLRQTRLFPIAFAIFWYGIVLLYLLTYGGLSAYQNYVNNIYFWLMVGVLFRLPDVLATPGGFDRGATEAHSRSILFLNPGTTR
jgi:hypothetical protein